MGLNAAGFVRDTVNLCCGQQESRDAYGGRVGEWGEGADVVE